MEVTQINFLGITVTEPFTWLTNWTVAAFSFYFGHMLFHAKSGDRQRSYWSVFFLFMGIASTTGGTAHGFIRYVGNNFHYAAWIFTGVAVFGAQMASLEIIKGSGLYRPLKWFIIVELVVMTAAVVFLQSFETVRVNSALGLIGMALPLQLYGFKVGGMNRNGIIALGIVSNAVPALIHAAKFSYNRWFNFNDLSHIVMIGCFYIIYRGAKKAPLAQAKVQVSASN